MSIRGHCLKPKGAHEQNSLGNNGLGSNARDFQFKDNSISICFNLHISLLHSFS